MKTPDELLMELRGVLKNEQDCTCQEAYCQHVMDLVDASQKVVAAWEWTRAKANLERFGMGE